MGFSWISSLRAVLALTVLTSSASARTPQEETCNPVAFDGSPYGQLVDVSIADELQQKGWAVDAILFGEQSPAAAQAATYVVIDERGYLGTLSVLPAGWNIGPRCDHCASWERGAVWQRKPTRKPHGVALAIGPLRNWTHPLLVRPMKANVRLVGSDAQRFVDLNSDRQDDVHILRRSCDASSEAVEVRVRSKNGWRTTQRNVYSRVNDPLSGLRDGNDAQMASIGSPQRTKLSPSSPPFQSAIDQVTAQIAQEEYRRWSDAALAQERELPSRDDALMAASPNCQSVRGSGSHLRRMSLDRALLPGESMISPKFHSPRVISGDGPRPRAGQLFIQVDDRGVVGVLRATAERIDFRCYDSCPDWWHGAAWEQVPKRSARSDSIILGPVDRPYPKARVLERRSVPPGFYVLVDLDGDAAPDFRWSTYYCGCEHYAVETMTRAGNDWQVTERNVEYILPMASSCP